MPQPMKYLIVALICLGLGAVLGIVLHTHLSPSALVQTALKAGQPVASKDNQRAQSPSTTAGTQAPSTSPSSNQTAHPAATPSDKKEPAPEAKETTDQKDEANEYLRSLWPVKKRPSPNLSGTPQGPVYMEGTLPYGPPPTYKEDLLAETKRLNVPGDPPPRIAPPLTIRPRPTPLVSFEEAKPQESLYQIELGQFSSLEKAQQAADLLQQKGHEVHLYYAGPVHRPDWFYVRLAPHFSKTQAYQKAQTIALLEKIIPHIVAVSPNVKKLT
ncbi:MAG: SPOR domain-containing protein [Alphaproteobacteria bacterium]